MLPKLRLTLGVVLIAVVYFIFNSKVKVKKLSFSTLSIPNQLNSHKTISYNDVVIIDNLFPRLFKRNSTLEYDGDLADQWSLNKNQKKLEIILKNKSFSDGSYISADDIVLSIKDAIKPEMTNSFFFRNIKNIRKISENKIEIDYIGWEGLLFQQLSSPFLSIYKNGKAPNQEDISSWVVKFPLKIEKWSNKTLEVSNSENNILLKLIIPTLDNIHNLDVVLSRESSLITGSNLLTDEYFKNNFNSYSFDTYNSKLILLNERIPLNTRKCVSHLINQNEEINNIYNNHRSTSLIPQGVLGFSPYLANKNLIQEKKKTLIKLDLIVRENEIVNKKLIEVLLNNLDKCNVDLKIATVTNNEYYNKLLSRDYDLTIATISTQYNDPTFLLSFFHPKSKINLTGTSNAIGEAIDRINSSENREQVIENAIEAQKLIYEYAVAIPLATVPTYSFVRKPLKIKSDVFFDVIRWEDFYE